MSLSSCSKSKGVHSLKLAQLAVAKYQKQGQRGPLKSKALDLMPCLLVSDSEDRSGVFQLQSGPKVQDLPNNKKSIFSAEIHCDIYAMNGDI